MAAKLHLYGILFLILIGYVHPLHAQIKTYDNGTILFKDVIGLTSPALLDSTSQVFIGNQGLNSDFNNVRTFYIGSNFLLHKNIRTKSYAGFHVKDDQNGAIIHNILFQGHYMTHITLSPQLQTIFAIEGGFVNLNFLGTSVTGGGSDISIDFDAHAALLGKNWRAGIIFNHLTQPVLIPINDQFTYPFNIELFGEYRYKVAYHTSLILAQQTLWTSSDFIFRGQLSSLFRQKYEIGLGTKNGSFSVIGGLHKIQVQRLQTSLHFGYQFPHMINENLNFHLYQLQLNIHW